MTLLRAMGERLENEARYRFAERESYHLNHDIVLNRDRSMKPAVDVVIVNWNTGEQLNNCLESIAKANGDGFVLSRIRVIDNASTDYSMRGIHRHELPVHTIYNKRNLGFAVASNLGSAGSKADYLLFLNPDIELLKDSLSIPLDFMEKPENSQAGICGIQLLDDTANVTHSCARFPTPGRFLARTFGLDRLLPRIFKDHFMTDWDHRNTREVDQVMGAFFLVRRPLFQVLGGFDERFFVYYEDLDFSYRARQRGWNSVYISTAQAIRKNTGTAEAITSTRLFYSLRSRILYGYKHFSIWAARSLFIVTLFIEPLTRIGWAILRRSGSEIAQTSRGYLMLWKTVPTLLRSARKSRGTCE